jgi:hypothetical protein
MKERSEPTAEFGSPLLKGEKHRPELPEPIVDSSVQKACGA